MIFKNGTVKDDLQYKDLCKEEHEVRIAYNNEYTNFEIDNITNSVVEYPYWISMVEASDYGQLSHEFELLKSFFSKFNMFPHKKSPCKMKPFSESLVSSLLNLSTLQL